MPIFSLRHIPDPYGLATHADVAISASSDDMSLGLSTGSRLAWEDGTDPLGFYALEAWIPRDPWAGFRLTRGDALSTQDDSLATTIALVPRSDSLVEEALHLGVNDLTSIQACNSFNNGNAHQELVKAAKEAYSPTVSGVDNIRRSLGVRIGEPELPTTTWDYDAKLQLGLHVDDWDRMSLDDRDKAGNRLCVNLGTGIRYLLFLPFTIRRIFELISAKETSMQHLDPVHRFLQAYPEFPVCRLALAPGKAYIAPTDNLVHDGSTAGCSAIDISLAILGRFKLEHVG